MKILDVRYSILLMIAVILAGAATTARADTKVGFRAGLGPTFAGGFLAHTSNVGFALWSAVEVAWPESPWALDLQLGWQRFGADQAKYTYRDLQIGAAGRFLVLRSRLQLGVLAGFSLHRQWFDYQSAKVVPGPDVGVLAAYDLGDLDLFVEARWQAMWTLDDGIQTAPVVAGVRFRPGN